VARRISKALMPERAAEEKAEVGYHVF
jgi:hypothetical protein